MNEQQLMNYEGAKYEFDILTEEFNEIRAKMFSVGSVNFSKVGSRSTRNPNDDRLIENIEKMGNIREAHGIALSELQQAKFDFENALIALDPVERAYCQKRYIEAKTNKEIAKCFQCSVRKVFYIRKSVLQKIKDL